MPLTPYHWGPPLLVAGLFFLKTSKPIHKENLFCLLVVLYGAIIPDIQGIYSITVDPSVKLHGFSHTLVGATVYSLVSTCIYLVTYRLIEKIFDMDNSPSLITIFFLVMGSIILFHFLFDILIWSDMMILWPFSEWSIGDRSRYRGIANVMGFGFLGGILLLSISIQRQGEMISKTDMMQSEDKK